MLGSRSLLCFVIVVSWEGTGLIPPLEGGMDGWIIHQCCENTCCVECAADSAAGIDGGWITCTHTLPLPSLGLYCHSVEAVNALPAGRLIAVAGVVLYCRQIDPLCISALSETDRRGAPWICSVPSVIILINERWKPEWWSGYLHGGNYHMQTPHRYLDREKSVHRQTGRFERNALIAWCLMDMFLRPGFWHEIVNIAHICR